jgi:DNA-directed RNA polymerase subunit RPC12/RpoP
MKGELYLGTEISCPSCGSNDQVQRVAMAHAQSTSVVYDEKNRAVGTQKTAAGVMLSPPIPKKMWWRWVLTVWAGLTTVSAIASVGTQPPVAILFVIVMIAITGLLYFRLVKPTRRYNSTVYAQQYAEWQNSWVCLKCGTLFNPQADGSKVAAARNN